MKLLISDDKSSIVWGNLVFVSVLNYAYSVFVLLFAPYRNEQTRWRLMSPDFLHGNILCFEDCPLPTLLDWSILIRLVVVPSGKGWAWNDFWN